MSKSKDNFFTQGAEKLNEAKNKAMEEANADFKKISKETKQLADKVKEEYKTNYEDMERKAIRGMTSVYDKAKIELDQLVKDAEGQGTSTTQELDKKFKEVQKKTSAQLEMIKRESEQSLNANAIAKLKQVCPDSSSDDYYKCTLKEAYKKAEVLFEEQRKQFSEQSNQTYKSIMKDMDKTYSRIVKEASNKNTSTNDDQGRTKKGSR